MKEILILILAIPVIFFYRNDDDNKDYSGAWYENWW